MSVIANLDINLRGNTQNLDQATTRATANVRKLKEDLTSHAEAIQNRFSTVRNAIGGILDKIPGGQMVAGLVGKMLAPVTIAVSGFTRSLAQLATGGVLTSLSTMLGTLGASLAALVGPIMAVVGAWSALGLANLSEVSSLGKMSDRLGLSTESLSGLAHAAKMGGIDLETLDHILTKANVKLSEAAQGAGTAAKALARMGLDAQQLNNLPLDQYLAKISGALVQMKNQGDQAAFVEQTLGKAGLQMLGTLRKGPEALKQAMQEASDMGLVVSRQEAQRAQDAQAAMRRMSEAFTGIGRTAAISIAPFVEMLASAVQKGLTWFNQYRDSIIDFSLKGIFYVQQFCVGSA
jgi:hypothetical protein